VGKNYKAILAVYREEANTIDRVEIEERHVATAKATAATTLHIAIAQECTTAIAKLTTCNTRCIAVKVKELVKHFETIVSKFNVV
jgi:hypothetical protein